MDFYHEGSFGLVDVEFVKILHTASLNHEADTSFLSQ